jgi:hypothetical protein
MAEDHVVLVLGVYRGCCDNASKRPAWFGWQCPGTCLHRVLDRRPIRTTATPACSTGSREDSVIIAPPRFHGMVRPVATLTPPNEKTSRDRCLVLCNRSRPPARSRAVFTISPTATRLSDREMQLPIIGTSLAADRYRKVIDCIRAHPDDYDDGFNGGVCRTR